MNNRPTPETDAFAIKFKTLCGEKYWVPVDIARKLERERDEARESTLRIDVLNFKLRKELDDAKSKIKSQADRIRYLEGATNHAKGTPLSVALRERDEARQDLEHWKSEWEIVEARLCGWKHPRDNGIIFEHEVIPVLRKELDDAREEVRLLKAILDVIKKEAQ